MSRYAIVRPDWPGGTVTARDEDGDVVFSFPVAVPTPGVSTNGGLTDEQAEQYRNTGAFFVPPIDSVERTIIDYQPSLYYPLHNGLDIRNGFLDFSGWTRNGTRQNGISILGGHEVGLHPGAAYFNGTSQSIFQSDGYNPWTAGDKTFMGWAKRASNNSGNDPLMGSGASTARYAVILLGQGDQNLAFKPNDIGSGWATWTAAWPGNNVWVHWAIVANTATNSASLYINGNFVSTFSGMTDDFATGQVFEVGTYAQGGGGYFHGYQAHVAVFEYALNAGQITNIYNAGRYRVG